MDPEQFLEELINYLREFLLLKIDPDFQDSFVLSFTSDELSEFKALITDFSKTELENSLERFIEAKSKMIYSSLPQLPIELAVVKICIGS